MNIRSYVDMHAGGSGSGCQGPNCGRPPGSARSNDHKIGDRVYSVHQTGDKGVVQKTSGPWHLVKTDTKGDQVYHDKELTKVPRIIQGKEMVDRVSATLSDTVTRFEAQKLRDASKPATYSRQAYAKMKANQEYNSDLLLNRTIVGNRMVDTVRTMVKGNADAEALADRASQIFHRTEAGQRSEDTFQRTNTAKLFEVQNAGLRTLQTALDKIRHDTMKGEATGEQLGIYMDGFPTFHPPSLKNPQKVPADQPGETDDRFLDVTKRKRRETEIRRDRLTRNTQGQPIPVRTTLVEPGTYVPLDKA